MYADDADLLRKDTDCYGSSFFLFNSFVKVQNFEKACRTDIIKICVDQRFYEVNPHDLRSILSFISSILLI
ncbi:hypothetical protein B0A81_02055 [Flavobacterium plurextorum]|uniref:HEPN domain-containing protein n=1 Tax=Flavobacterium plurextorum TaxID=1114867 RepID=A0ABX4CZK3_9FLAO|nr:hypothetical protein B0A81_02055 [Flavobacterium plurextorum]